MTNGNHARGISERLMAKMFKATVQIKGEEPKTMGPIELPTDSLSVAQESCEVALVMQMGPIAAIAIQAGVMTVKVEEVERVVIDETRMFAN